jgi:hypothetical protein
VDFHIPVSVLTKKNSKACHFWLCRKLSTQLYVLFARRKNFNKIFFFVSDFSAEGLKYLDHCKHWNDSKKFEYEDTTVNIFTNYL